MTAQLVGIRKRYVIRFDYTEGHHLTLDWGWRGREIGWTIAEQTSSGGWDYYGPMQAVHSTALLDHFGLVGYRHVPRFDGGGRTTLRFWSPKKLLMLRRQREKEEGLSKQEPVSHSNSHPISALFVD